MYLWVKALHVIAIISWMAGLLYLPRLFVYHADAAQGSGCSETFKIMERKLLYMIMTPAMIVAWVTGLFLAIQSGFFHSPWFHAKLIFVLLMTLTHFALGKYQHDFKLDRNKHSTKFFRVFNEVPTILMIFIVVLVVVKPF
ncbi:protoporphyrinogen oxidase HemJ [Rhodoblastus acidophilus]|uniref:Protoporphyrinogen IX oxidase n=1 Tax=Candidatus Rhodoblastus alkanivorans TaxID=2954117 RepID=A0ABS9Z1L5_9HYPH|nr:protoporphyrinogen oxidase HemJ [Candidatus Rhodoblastus alkanivorans]MCI4678109.1 protoporphyrinogen oxidase HemJ [Candidatus Rhodoblastus alkanivorans]MCI4681550.1 protoporphyrinogen oxidase HemJ [Candidatus Rhodoblastus alkanivorans]MDI4642598.1 protoporphyrinogen oxidase HemJ [Rhodoblastus acidophilus]